MTTLSCLTKFNICLIRGQALEIDIPVLDQSGQPVDLSNAAVEVGYSESSRYPYQQTLTSTTSTNVITATITSTISAAFTTNSIYLSAWVTIAGESTPVARGYISIEPDSRSA